MYMKIWLLMSISKPCLIEHEPIYECLFHGIYIDPIFFLAYNKYPTNIHIDFQINIMQYFSIWTLILHSIDFVGLLIRSCPNVGKIVIWVTWNVLHLYGGYYHNEVATFVFAKVRKNKHIELHTFGMKVAHMFK